MRVLVTGASGFIGCQAISALVAVGASVHAISRKQSASPQYNWHQSDLLEGGAVERLISSVKPDAVLHLAWCADSKGFWTDPANLDWAAATIALAKSAHAHGVKRFVGVGTCYEYDWPSNGNCHELSTPTASHTLYDAAKDATRRLLEAYFVPRDVEFAWARPFFLCGPGEAPERLVASIARAIARGEKALCSRGLAVRDYMDVRDTGRALAALVLSHVTGPINVGSGNAIQISEIAKKLGTLAGRPDAIQLGALPDRQGEPDRIVADTARLRDEVHFKPSFALDSALRTALEYWADQEAPTYRAL